MRKDLFALLLFLAASLAAGTLFISGFVFYPLIPGGVGGFDGAFVSVSWFLVLLIAGVFVCGVTFTAASGTLFLRGASAVESPVAPTTSRSSSYGYALTALLLPLASGTLSYALALCPDPAMEEYGWDALILTELVFIGCFALSILALICRNRPFWLTGVALLLNGSITFRLLYLSFRN